MRVELTLEVDAHEHRVIIESDQSVEKETLIMSAVKAMRDVSGIAAEESQRVMEQILATHGLGAQVVPNPPGWGQTEGGKG